MKIISKSSGSTLIIELHGELDHHAAGNAIKKIGQTIDCELPYKTILSLSNLAFMDSSGIAVIINIFRRMQDIGGLFEISDMSNQAQKIFLAAGLNKVIKTKEMQP